LITVGWHYHVKLYNSANKNDVGKYLAQKDCVILDEGYNDSISEEQWQNLKTSRMEQEKLAEDETLDVSEMPELTLPSYTSN